MNIRAVYVYVFFLATIILTVAIYPRQRDMAELYLDSGEVRLAEAELQKALSPGSANFSLLMTGARINQLLGRTAEGVELLRRARELKPRNLMMLERLAQYLEWDMRPKEALEVYEAIVQERPERSDVLQTLVNHYRYYGMFAEETSAIARLVARRRPSVNTADSLIRVFQNELERLAHQRLEQGYEPVRDFLFQRLFIVNERFKIALQEEVPPPSRLEYVTFAIELYVRTGLLAEGEAFANAADAPLGTIDSRLRFATILQWNFLFAQAEDYLLRLAKDQPQRERVWVALSRVAVQNNNPELAEQSLETLVALKPENGEYKNELAIAYTQKNKFSEALTLLKEYVAVAVDQVRTLGEMLDLAQLSGKPEILRSAAESADEYDIDDEGLLRARADVRLSLDESEKAYPLLKRWAIARGEKHGDMAELLTVAGYTGNSALVEDAVSLAMKKAPDDAVLLRLGVEGYLSVEQTGKAYVLQRKLAEITQQEEDMVLMLELAGFSADPELVAEAAKIAVANRSASLTLLNAAIDSLVWTEQYTQAVRIAERAARLSGGSKIQVSRLIEVASFADDQTLVRDALRLAGKLRPHDASIASVAARAVAGSRDAASFEALFSRFAKKALSDSQELERWAVIADEGGLSDHAFRLYYQLWKQRKVRNEAVDPELRENVIRLAEWTERYSVAAEILGAASDENRKNFDLAMRAGTAFGAAEQTARALVYYDRALALRPQNRNALLEGARYAAYQSDFAKAVSRFEKYGTDKLSTDDGLLLAESYLNSGQGSKALAYFAPLLELDPVPKDRAFSILRALNIAGRRVEAEKLYLRLSNVYGGDRKFLSQLGAEAFFENHLNIAMTIFAKVLEKYQSDATALKGRAMIYAEQGSTTQAAKAFRRYLQFYAGDGDAHYRLAEILVGTGRTDEARRHYKEAARLLKDKLPGSTGLRKGSSKRKQREKGLVTLQ